MRLFIFSMNQQNQAYKLGNFRMTYKNHKLNIVQPKKSAKSVGYKPYGVKTIVTNVVSTEERVTIRYGQVSKLLFSKRNSDGHPVY